MPRKAIPMALCLTDEDRSTLCDLAHAWWDTRLHPGWRPRSREENQTILDSLGLVDLFWTLP